MTTFTGARYALEDAANMAGLAAQSSVLAGKEKTGPVMIEFLRFCRIDGTAQPHRQHQENNKQDVLTGKAIY